MEHIEEIVAKNKQKAWEVIKDTDIINIWQSAGTEINLVGSLKTKLLVKHRDIDFHIYTENLHVANSFSAMAKLALNPRIKRIEYGNLMNTDERCLEWHAWYEDDNQELWQLDLIHIERGLQYDGHFERVAERITEVLNEETRQAILRLKYETPETAKIMGVVYYRAVLGDGVRTYAELIEWMKKNPTDGVLEWMP